MRSLKGDQPKAFEQIKEFLASGTGMHLLHGYAGTGKTYLMRELVQYANMTGIKTAVTAPTHKAVKVLKSFIQERVDYYTTHASLGMKEFIDDHGVLSFSADPIAGYPAEKYDLIIIDEASMLDDALFEELINLKLVGKKILFVGDPFQIPPVNHMYAKPFLKEVQKEQEITISGLKEIIRQEEGNPIIENAFSIRENVQSRHAILKRQTVKNEKGEVNMIPMTDQGTFEHTILPMYKTFAYLQDIDFVKIIAWRNDTVNLYNNMVRDYVFGSGIPKIIKGDRLIADAPIVEDRFVYISTNEEMEVLDTSIEFEKLSEEYILQYYKTRVKVLGRIDNGFNEYMLRIIHEDSEKTFDQICQLQKIVAKSYPVGSYKAKSAWMDYYQFLEHWHRIKYSYCITAHKSQGSTYHTAYILEWDIMANRDIFERNRIMYTACTRPSKNLFIEY